MVSKGRKRAYDQLVGMYYERFANYEEQEGDIPEKNFKFRIRVYFDETDQWILHTNNMNGSEMFLSRMEKAYEMQPDEIEITELTEKGKEIEGGKTVSRLTKPKPGSKQEKREKERAQQAEQSQKGSQLKGAGEGSFAGNDTALQLEVMKVESRLNNEIQTERFKNENLQRDVDDLKEINRQLEAELNAAQTKMESSSLGNVLGGFFQKNSGLLTGVLGKLASGGAALDGQGAATASDGVLAGLNDQRAIMITDFAEVARALDDESFEKLYTVMYTILQNPPILEDVYELISVDETENEQQSEDQKAYTLEDDNNQLDPNQ